MAGLRTLAHCAKPAATNAAGKVAKQAAGKLDPMRKNITVLTTAGPRWIKHPRNALLASSAGMASYLDSERIDEEKEKVANG